MDYQKIYNQIIERTQNRKLEGYKEKHHIIPKCMGGEDVKENLVDLTAREHFLCHVLLKEIYPKNLKLAHAIFLMNEGITRNNYTPSSGVYERLKRERSKLFKGDYSVIGKKIIQYSLEGEFIKIWNSLKFAGKSLKISDGDISKTCRKKQNSAGGFQWGYFNENYSSKIPSIIRFKKPENFNENSPLKGKPRIKEHYKGRFKPILQYSLEGELLREFESIREACMLLWGTYKTYEQGIQSCCSKKQKTSYGYKWEYKTNRNN